MTRRRPSYPNGLIWHMYKGDVIGYDWNNDDKPDHTGVVAAYDDNNYPPVNTHNDDRYHAPWDLEFGSGPTYYLVRMKATITVP